jgi:hypothetical protein
MHLWTKFEKATHISELVKTKEEVWER